MSAPAQLMRLPQAPSEYNQSYMGRLINTIELERQAAYFAQSGGGGLALKTRLKKLKRQGGL